MNRNYDTNNENLFKPIVTAKTVEMATMGTNRYKNHNNYRPLVYLGYDENVSIVMIDFIEKTFTYYTTIYRFEGTFINDVNEFWKNFLKDLLGFITGKRDNGTPVNNQASVPPTRGRGASVASTRGREGSNRFKKSRWAFRGPVKERGKSNGSSRRRGAFGGPVEERGAFGGPVGERGAFGGPVGEHGVNSTESESEDLQDIVNSFTFKAIIYSFINFYMLRGGRQACLEALREYFGLLREYLLNDEGLENLLFAHHEGSDFNVSRVKFIMMIQILSHTAFIRNKRRNNENSDQRNKGSNKLLSIFQETIYAITLNIVLKKTCNSFVCNLPGLADCVTIWKKTDKYFIFTECKLSRTEALSALPELDALKGKNMTNPRNPGFIHRIDDSIFARIFSSFIHNYYEGQNNRVFTLGILELNDQTAMLNEFFYNLQISEKAIQELNAFCAKFQQYFENDDDGTKPTLLGAFGIKFTKSQKRRPDPTFPLVNFDQDTRPHRADRAITTTELGKLSGKFQKNFNIRDENHLDEVRAAIFEKQFEKQLKLKPRNGQPEVLQIWKDPNFKSSFNRFGLTQNEISNLMSRHLPEDIPLHGMIHDSPDLPFLIADKYFFTNNGEKNSVPKIKLQKPDDNHIACYNPIKKKYYYYPKPEKESNKLEYATDLGEWVHIISGNKFNRVILQPQHEAVVLPTDPKENLSILKNTTADTKFQERVRKTQTVAAQQTNGFNSIARNLGGLALAKPNTSKNKPLRKLSVREINNMSENAAKQMLKNFFSKL